MKYMDIKNTINGKVNRKKPVLRESYECGSAVLIPLIEKNHAYEVLFEVRAASLKAQPGEVCFPGGRMEQGETHQETAVRETMEELLLNPAQIEVIAAMDGITEPGSRPMWPFVGVLHDYQGTFSRDEVDRVFTVPFQWFFQNRPERYETRQITRPPENFPFGRIPGGRAYPWRQRPYDVLFYNWPGEEIWGITAKIMDLLIQDCMA